MSIEGPLRELGIHDVFQLLDLSRKTGTLTVTSTMRDNQGTVYFERGAVVHAAMKNNPQPLGGLLLRAGKITENDLVRARELQARDRDPRRLGEILVSMGAVTPKEVERQVRFQVEEVIFELMSWHEGHFSFDEGGALGSHAEAPIRISTESLLMEGARRIDEWSRIEGKVRHVGMVPVLAEVEDDHPTLLDLLPSEWEVLAEIDGVRDLRGIATALARSEFDVGKVVYGLATTGVIELRDRANGAKMPVVLATEAAAELLEHAGIALRRGELDAATESARAAVEADPHSADAHVVLARALILRGQRDDGAAELKRALQLDAGLAAVHLELGFCAASRGDFAEAEASWDRYLRMSPDAPDAERVRAAMETVSRLRTYLTEHLHV
jgi:hypothetical protein